MLLAPCASIISIIGSPFLQSERGAGFAKGEGTLPFRAEDGWSAGPTLSAYNGGRS